MTGQERTEIVEIGLVVASKCYELEHGVARKLHHGAIPDSDAALYLASICRELDAAVERLDALTKAQ